MKLFNELCFLSLIINLPILCMENKEENSLVKSFDQMDISERFDDLLKRLGEINNRVSQKKYIHETDVKRLMRDCEQLIKEKRDSLAVAELVRLESGKKDLESTLLGLQLNPIHQSEKLYNKIFKKT